MNAAEETAYFPHWSMAKIDFVYECCDCGAEVRQTVRKPDVIRH